MNNHDQVKAQITDLLNKMAEPPASDGSVILNFGRAWLAAALQVNLIQAEMAEEQAGSKPESKETE